MLGYIMMWYLLRVIVVVFTTNINR